MGEVLEMDQDPQFKLDVGTTYQNSETAEVAQRLNEAAETFQKFESLVNGDPQSALDALKVYLAAFKPGNRDRSVQEIAKSEGINTETNNILPAYGIWDIINKSGHFVFLQDFEPAVEDTIDKDQQVKQLVKELRDPRNRNTDETRTKIRAARMQVYIGLFLKDTVSIDPLDSPPTPEEVAASDTAA